MGPQLTTINKIACRFPGTYPLSQQPVSLATPRFPVTRAERRFAGEKTTIPATRSNTKSRLIFIVDDDTDDKELFIEAVKELDNEILCRTAWNGEEALEVLQQMDELPACIFMDINMPRMNGKKCLDEIKKHDRLNRIPVVMLTTSALEEEIDETRRLGADFFLTKPNTFRDLKKAISSVLFSGDEIQKSGQLIKLH